MSHNFIVKEWLVTLLTNDSTLNSLIGGRIFEDIAPEGTNYPLVVFSKATDLILKSQNSIIYATNFTYNVRCIDQNTSYLPIKPVADRLDVLLHRVTGETSTGWIVYSVKNSTLEIAELDVSGINYRHLGGIYEILAQDKV